MQTDVVGKRNRSRAAVILGFFALLGVLLSPGPVRAGTMLVSYGLGPGISVEPHTMAWTAVGGFATVVVTATRSSAAATFGVISGGTVLSLILSGGPTHAPPYGTTFWSIAGGPPGPGVPPLILPSIMGTFAGLTAAGSAFTPGGGFFFAAPPPPGPPNAPAVGHFNPVIGPGVFSGFFGISAVGAGTSGVGSGLVCFNAVAGFGPCTTGLTASPAPSVPAAGTVSGFGSVGGEVGRVVSIEPVPEPGTGLLLGLGTVGLAVGARRLRRIRH